MLRLYYFTSERYGLEAISDNRLKIARINELNDPFEFLGLALNRGDRRVLTSLKNDLDNQYGLLCMSKDWTHPLLWSHYADSHRGLCLGFDIRPSAQHKFQEVIYRKDRPTLKAIGIQDLGGMDLDRTMKLLRTKFDSWTDEGERRAFIGLTDKDPVSDLYF